MMNHDVHDVDGNNDDDNFQMLLMRLRSERGDMHILHSYIYSYISECASVFICFCSFVYK